MGRCLGADRCIGLTWTRGPARRPPIPSGPARSISCAKDSARHKTGLVAAALAAPLSVALFLMAAPLQYRAVARLAIPVSEGDNAGAALAGEARLIASREFGRRAIKELGAEARPEFVADGLSPIGGALVFLGLAPDPSRVSRDERILKSYADRLSVSAAQGGLDIGFRSGDRAFAAAAANRIAALYLDLRGKVPDGAADAPALAPALLSPALKPARPLLPARRIILCVAGGAALAALAFTALRRPRRMRVEAEAPMEPPRAVGDAPVFVRLGEPKRALSQAGQNAAAKRTAEDDADRLDSVAARIVATRREGGALRIVGAGLSPGGEASSLMLTLARRLGNEGRSILVRLDDADGGADAAALSGEPGVRDLDQCQRLVLRGDPARSALAPACHSGRPARGFGRSRGGARSDRGGRAFRRARCAGAHL